MIGNIHYAPINDLAWCSNNEILIACSSDGYSSIMNVKQHAVEGQARANIFGERLPNAAIEDEILRAHYMKLDQVNLSYEESKVKNQKGSQFQPIAFRKKPA